MTWIPAVSLGRGNDAAVALLLRAAFCTPLCWPTATSAKNARFTYPNVHLFYWWPFFFFSFCSIFSAAAIILNNISPPVAEALQCNGELFWRYKSLDLKNLPGVSVLCTTFLLCWSLYLAHAKEHLTFKDPFCTSSKCLHPLLLD